MHGNDSKDLKVNLVLLLGKKFSINLQCQLLFLLYLYRMRSNLIRDSRFIATTMMQVNKVCSVG